MIDKLIGLVRRMTVWERAVLLLMLAAPLVVCVALVAGVWADDALLDVVVLLVYGLVVVATGGLAAARRWFLRRRFLASREQPIIARTAGDGGSGEHRVIVASMGYTGHALRTFGARTGSTWVRDVLAYRATGGRLDFAALSAAMRSQDPGAASLIIGRPIPRDLITLMRVLSEQPNARQDVVAILRFLANPANKVKLGREEQMLVAERLILAGRADAARPLVQQWATDGLRSCMLATDLINPFGAPTEPSSEVVQLWFGAFNQIFRPYGLEAPQLGAEGRTPFDRLEGRATQTREGGPLISVIMTCYRPGPELLTAVRSVAAQSWTNWELLLVDDASGPEFDEILVRAESIDRRVRLIRGAQNAGTYVRRNDALSAAHGEFVTMHDSDDWMHPRRLELQAVRMLDESDLIGVLSTSLRVTESLLFTQPRGTTLRPAETSIMFRRAPALAKVGYYDEVRKAADSEYRLRLEAAFGQTVPIIDTGGPLTLVRYLPQSLSGSEIGDGWMHPARVAYRSAARHWHEKIRAGAASPRLTHPLIERPFPAPRHLLGHDEVEQVLDLVLVLDGRAGANPPGHLETVAGEIEVAVDAGMSVGIMHVDSVGTDTQLGIFPEALQELVSSGRATRIIRGEPARARLAIVRNASVLHGHREARSGVSADRVILIEDRQSGRDRVDIAFTPSAVRTIAHKMFGVRPEYVVAEGRVDLCSFDLPAAPVPADPADVAAREELVRVAPPRTSPADDTGWAAEPVTILELVRSALTLDSPSAVLELGSGFSTMWLALARAAHDGTWRHVALEHDERFLAETERLLQDQGVADLAEVRAAPLRPVDIRGERYSWYDTAALDGLDNIRLLFVDGPPRYVRIGSRFPGFPLVEPMLAHGALILLDDVDREEESAMIDHWRDWLGERGELTVERIVGRTAFVRFHRSS